MTGTSAVVDDGNRTSRPRNQVRRLFFSSATKHLRSVVHEGVQFLKERPHGLEEPALLLLWRFVAGRFVLAVRLHCKATHT